MRNYYECPSSLSKKFAKKEEFKKKIHFFKKSVYLDTDQFIPIVDPNSEYRIKINNKWFR